MENLVSTEWLAGELGARDLVVLDASAHLPGVDRDAEAEFAAAHIPDARRLALSRLADPDHPAPGMVPPAQQFAREIGALGIANDTRVVIYDDSAIHTAYRGWYLFRLFGHENVAVLDGGLAKWRTEGRPLESGASQPTEPRDYSARRDDNWLRLKAQVLEICDSGAEQLVDARGPDRFTGEAEEIRTAMPSGHMPGARNLPYPKLFHPDGTMQGVPELRAAFEAAGIDLDKPITTTCGSGVTAAILLFALDRIGKADIALYDGSWSEWAADPGTPKVTGPA